MKKTNTIVVGQGIAGTLMAFLLLRDEIPFLVFDPGLANTSSRIAAGMFTPVTGKRKTIHPLVAAQIDLAMHTYREMETLLGCSLLYQQDTYQVYHSEMEKNELTAKMQYADFAKYITPAVGSLPCLKQERGACRITHSGWIDCEALIVGFGQWLKQNDALAREEFLYSDLRPGNGTMQYRDYEFSNIIFCEGWLGKHNPFFAENIIPCSGDILTVRYDGPTTDLMIKKDGAYLIPSGDSLFRAGSTYRWGDDSGQPDKAGRKLIEDKLDAMLANRYEVIEHKAGIRPTTKNRDLIARQHPGYTNMFMLNGLGTRGVLQGPWGARQILQMVCSR